MDKVEEADRLRIVFKTTKNLYLIAQKCAPHEGCTVVDTPGVSLIFGKGCLSVILQKVNISRSGLYIAQACFGKDVYEVNATLVVNKAAVSSASPPHSSSSPKPLRSSELQWLYALITAVVIFIIFIIVLVFCSFCRWRRILCFKRKNTSENSSSDCVSVASNGCGENAEALLTRVPQH